MFISHGFSLNVNDAFEHGFGVRKALSNIWVATKMAQLQKTVSDGLAARIDESDKVFLTVGTEDHLGVVLKEVHLETYTERYHQSRN